MTPSLPSASTAPLKTLCWTPFPDAAERLREAGAQAIDALAVTALGPDAPDVLAQLPEAEIIVLHGAGLAPEQLESAVRCRAIIHADAGAAGLDLELARRLGIFVSSVPEAATPAWAAAATAELEAFHAAWLEARPARKDTSFRRHPRVGLVGLGLVGREIAQAARALKMDVWAYDPFALPETFAHCEARRAIRLHDALGIADLVFVQVAPANDNCGLVSAGELGLMKPGAWLVNLGWPEALDLEAAAAALHAGRLARVAAAGVEPAGPVGISGIAFFDPRRGREREIEQRGLAAALRIAVLHARGEEIPHLLIDPPLPRVGA